MLLLLLFSDLPKLGSMTPYYLYRTTRRVWLMGQFVYVICVSMLYTAFLFLTTVLLCMKMSYVGDVWSETAAMLAYSKLGKDLSVPSTVKVMESITPYGCVLQVLLLLFLYTLCLSFLILAGNLLFSGNRGIVLGLLYSMYGVLLDPRVLGAILHKEEYEMYQINILIGWVSPLSHVTYAKHNFGYDRLPTVGQSCLLFTGILLVLSVICMRAMRRYSFRFLGSGADNTTNDRQEKRDGIRMETYVHRPGFLAFRGALRGGAACRDHVAVRGTAVRHIFTMVQKAFCAKPVCYLLPVIAVLPWSDSFLREWKSGYLKGCAASDWQAGLCGNKNSDSSWRRDSGCVAGGDSGNLWKLSCMLSTGEGRKHCSRASSKCLPLQYCAAAWSGLPLPHLEEFAGFWAALQIWLLAFRL
ncbi:MAG: hypothetical protein ACLTSZ_10985 [Lachnospiraceae bacterium]